MIKYTFFFIFFSLIHLLAVSQDKDTMKYFELDKLSQENAESEGAYLPFLNEPSLSMGLYELSRGSEDRQQPHKRDEIYYITKGMAKLTVGKDTVAVHTGSVIYVKAEATHRFVDIKEDLQMLVVFSNSEPSPDDPDWLAFEIDELTKKRNPNEIGWNQFLNVGTMRMGLDMISESGETMTDKSDNIHIVIEGRSKVTAEDDTVELKPGSIFFLAKETGYRFHEIQEGLEVLMLSPKE